MLTRSRLKRGEGQLEIFNPEIGHAYRINKMEDEEYREKYEKAFHNAFYHMEDKVEKMFSYYQERLAKKKTKKEKVEDNALLNQGRGGDPFEPPSPSSSSSSE